MGNGVEKRINVSVRGQKRILLVFAVLIFVLLILMFRTAWIQIVNGEEYTDRAVDQQTSDIAIAPKRGIIYDRNGSVLASSTICYNIWIRPRVIRDKYDEAKRLQIATEISEIIGMDLQEVLNSFQSDYILLRLAKQVDKDQKDRLKELEIYGMETAEDTKRLYPLGTTAATLLGSVNDDGVGRSGIELAYNEYLSGVSGRKVFEKDINGNLLAFGDRVTYDAENGLNVELTIDEVLQHYMDEAVMTGLKTTEAERVAGIAMDPKSGEILAMSIVPTFDPNNPTLPADESQRAAFAELSDEEQLSYLNKLWRNQLVSDVYEPGSTLKLVTSSATLEEGLATPTSEFYCNGYITVEDYDLYDAEHYIHGAQTLTQAVGNSCNPIHARLALNLGYDKFYKYIELYGLNDITGVDFPGESLPIVQDKDLIGPVELATMGFGQGIAITPIQLITAISAIGNDGVLMRPHFVKKLTDSTGNTVIEYAPESVRKVISASTAQEMRSIMESQVEYYGGSSVKIPGYRMGGKTGTANRASDDGYSETIIDTSFISMVPIEDPEVIVLIVCYGPKKGKYATETAIPIAKNFWIKALPYLGIEPSDSSEISSSSSEYAYVPDVTGMTLKQAEEALKACGLTYAIRPVPGEDEIVDDFVVVDQYPKAGKKIDKKEPVYLYRE